MTAGTGAATAGAIDGFGTRGREGVGALASLGKMIFGLFWWAW